MHADILNNDAHFNQLKMTRYTLSYDHISKDLFMKFVKEENIDFGKCERVQMPNQNGHSQVLELQINVKDQNQSISKNVNINEVFKFTCQRYHSYISQVIEYFKQKSSH